jgi:hypothetical protein
LAVAVAEQVAIQEMAEQAVLVLQVVAALVVEVVEVQLVIPVPLLLELQAVV